MTQVGDPQTEVDAEVGPEVEALDLGELGLDRGGHLLLRRTLDRLPAGAALDVGGEDPHLGIHVRAWCRAHGHGVEPIDDSGSRRLRVRRGAAPDQRWHGAERAGGAGADGVVRQPPPSWGLAARGALVERGGPSPVFDLADSAMVWSELAPRLYAQAAASQWDPATAIDWTAPPPPADVELAVVQVMTFLIENEQAALTVPARFLGRIHPHFREVVQLLAVQVADEARHVEVFTRRALLHGHQLGTSGVGGRASLASLLDEPDFALATFLLSVLGEGSFLSLLSFIERHAPDPVTARVAHLVLQDESRHVAFGMAHLQRTVEDDPGLRDRMRAAVKRRHDALAATSGLNEDTFDALVVLAAGSWEPGAIASGYGHVEALLVDMEDGRRRRLARLGFSVREASELAALHTRNFM